MSDQEIKAGSIVQLKSGGPMMTVNHIGDEDDVWKGHAYCDWFVQDKPPWKKQASHFRLTSLRLVQP